MATQDERWKVVNRLGHTFNEKYNRAWNSTRAPREATTRYAVTVFSDRYGEQFVEFAGDTLDAALEHYKEENAWELWDLDENRQLKVQTTVRVVS